MYAYQNPGIFRTKKTYDQLIKWKNKKKKISKNGIFL